jgi:hypothetical protein
LAGWIMGIGFTILSSWLWGLLTLLKRRQHTCTFPYVCIALYFDHTSGQLYLILPTPSHLTTVIFLSISRWQVANLKEVSCVTAFWLSVAFVVFVRFFHCDGSCIIDFVYTITTKMNLDSPDKYGTMCTITEHGYCRRGLKSEAILHN